MFEKLFLRTEKSGWFLGFFKKEKDSNTFTSFRRQKIAKKEIWKQTCLFFEKEKMFDQNYK